MPSKALILFYDGQCNLCHRVVRFVAKRDKKLLFAFAPLQGETAAVQLSKELINSNTVVLLDGEQVYIKSSAVFEVLKKMGFPYSLTAVLGILPQKLCDWGYGLIAQNRYRWWGKREMCEIPSSIDLSRFLK